MNNMDNFLITKVQNEYEKTKIENNFSPKIEEKKNIYFNKTLSRKDINQKISEKNINKELLNDNYLEFIIHEKIKYADMDKITEYYSQKIKSKLKMYNDNEILIEKKKKELNELNMSIYSNLVKNIKCEDFTSNEEFYNKEIEEIKKEIKHKEHVIEIYKDIYNQSYKLNFKLTKKLDKENIYCKIYDEQYQRYNDIYNNSINKMQRQENKLNELKSYFQKCKIINNSLISEKVQKINRLEYEILMIKNSVVNYQESLEKLQEKNIEYQKIVDLYKNGYNVRKNEFYFIRKVYLKEYYKMFEIYQIFNVDDFEQILEEFKLIKKKYNQLSLRFHEYSKEIMKLTMELKKKEVKLIKTKEEIDEKIKKANIDFKIFNNEQIDLFNTQKKEITSANLQIYNECKNRENLINICINYLLTIIHKIIHSLNNSINKSPFSFITKFTTKYNYFFNKDLTIININDIEKKDEQKFLLLIISLIKDARIFIYEIIINVFYNIYSIINSEQEQQNNDEQDEQNNYKINFIKSNSTIIQKQFNQQLKLSIQQLKLKKKIYSRNKDDILNNKNHVSINRKLSYSPSMGSLFNLRESQIYNKKKDFVSPDEFFQDYINYYIKNPIVDIDEFSCINKKLFVERYTNDLVTEKKYIELKKIEKMKKRQENSRIIKEKLEEKDLNNFLKKKKNIKILQKINKSVKRAEGEEDEEEEEKKYEKKKIMIKQELEDSKKPKVFKMKLSNPETDRILNRYEDIRMLEYNYIKNYSNYRIDPNIFNEYFYNVKKKFNEIIEKGNKISDLNNSNTGRNIFKAKGLYKNYSVILPKINKKERKIKNFSSMNSQ